ncbi:nucleotide disphospho-sugar-binding domain-containing protein [Nocardia sp. NPDC005978]|uniref:glycosyltransferase n=1 Tax=Nocardia sp. NPDC005978 TaxID=3156725 RepID=UPI0033A0B659
MRVLLAFAGSRGDAQPGVLLGRELLRRGHDVTLAVSPNLVEFATGHGIPVVGFGLDSAELLRAQEEDRRGGSWNLRARFRALLELQRRGFAEAARDLLAVADAAELLVTGMACEEVAAEVARGRDIPLAALHFFPIRPNRAVPVLPTALGVHLPGALNRAGWRALTALRARALAREIAAVRSVSPRKYLQRTSIQAYDAGLFPGLAAELRGDEPVTGFPVVPDSGTRRTAQLASGREPGRITPSAAYRDAPAAGLAATGAAPPDVAIDAAVAEPPSTESVSRQKVSAQGPGGTREPAVRRPAAAPRGIPFDSELHTWLDAGDPPVYVGFGSMRVGDPHDLELLVRTACKRLGRRLLLTGTAFRPGLTPDVAVVDQVDHGVVLPRCAAAVHHGGAGTTAAALRAGVPQVICAMQADQPFWGRQIETLGLGAAMPFGALSADRLERLLQRAADPDVVLRAAAHAARFRDDGVARAVDVIESLVSSALPAAPPERAIAPVRIGGAS